MSRSYRKPVVKDSAHGNRWYNKIYRTNWKRITRGIINANDDVKDDAEYPDKNTYVNQWSICDWNWNYIGMKLGEWKDDWRRRLTRK